MNVYPQQIPRGSTQDCQKRVFGKFPRLVSETLSRFPRQTYGENEHLFRLLPTAMTNRWHFDNTVTQFENLERNCTSCICSWLGAHKQQMVSGTFSGAWGSFNLKMKNSRTEKISLDLFRSKQGIRIGELLNRDWPSHSQWNYLLNDIIWPGCYSLKEVYTSNGGIFLQLLQLQGPSISTLPSGLFWDITTSGSYNSTNTAQDAGCALLRSL